MSWRLAGLIPVMRTSGPDVSRSAAQRAAGEAVWVPTALLPRFGVTWEARTDTSIVAYYDVDGHDVVLRLTIDDGGMVESVAMPRWGDPDETGVFGLHSFGGEFTEHSTFEGVTVPSAGALGWHYGTDRWPDGEFFRFRIDNLRPLHH